MDDNVIDFAEFSAEYNFDNSKEANIRRVIDMYLEEYNLEELLEDFKITPLDAFMNLYRAGYIDDDSIEQFVTDDQ